MQQDRISTLKGERSEEEDRKKGKLPIYFWQPNRDGQCPLVPNDSYLRGRTERNGESEIGMDRTISIYYIYVWISIEHSPATIPLIIFNITSLSIGFPELRISNKEPPSRNSDYYLIRENIVQR